MPPACSTFNSTTSSSQSSRTSRTFCTWPDCSPFFHRRLRERDQKCASPVATVLARDSRFIHARVSTLLVDISWAIAGTRPCSSHFTLSSQSSDIASADSKPDFDSALCHVFLRLAYGEFAEMKNACSQNRVGATFEYALGEMIELADTAARDHRDVHRLGDGAREREIEAFAGTVAVHAREQDFART